MVPLAVFFIWGTFIFDRFRFTNSSSKELKTEQSYENTKVHIGVANLDKLLTEKYNANKGLLIKVSNEIQIINSCIFHHVNMPRAL